MTNKKKSAAPKTEPKVKTTAAPAAKITTVSPKKAEADVGVTTTTAETIGTENLNIPQEETPVEEVAVKDPSSDLRFHVGDIAQHNGSNYLCIATNGQQCAVFVPSHIQTTYSRVIEQKCLLMNNEPVKE